MGHYSFIIEVDNENPELHPDMSTIKEIDLYLKVIKVPEVMFMNPRRRLLHRYYIANQIHDLKANINGFKIDRSSLQWTFRYSYINICSYINKKMFICYTYIYFTDLVMTKIIVAMMKQFFQLEITLSLYQ